MADALSDPTTLALAVLGAFLVGLSKGGLPGTGAFTVWIYAQIFGAKQSVAILLPLLICADLYAVLTYHRHTDWRIFRQLAPFLLVGAVAGALIFTWIPGEHFRPVIGAMILLVVVLHFLPRSRAQVRGDERKPEHRLLGPVFSAFSGMFSMLSNAGSPLMAYYLVRKGLPKFRFLGTYVTLILVSNLSSLPLHFAIHSVEVSTLPYSFGLGFLTVFGVLAARRIVELIPQRKYELLVWVIVTLAGIELLVW